MYSTVPVFPEDGSMIVIPGFNSPCRSASSTIFHPILSLVLPPGFKNSHLATAHGTRIKIIWLQTRSPPFNTRHTYKSRIRCPPPAVFYSAWPGACDRWRAVCSAKFRLFRFCREKRKKNPDLQTAIGAKEKNQKKRHTHVLSSCTWGDCFGHESLVHVHRLSRSGLNSAKYASESNSRPTSVFAFFVATCVGSDISRTPYGGKQRTTTRTRRLFTD